MAIDMENILTNQPEAGYQINVVTAWNSPPKTPALGDNDIHVWRAPLDLELCRVQNLYAA